MGEKVGTGGPNSSTSAQPFRDGRIRTVSKRSSPLYRIATYVLYHASVACQVYLVPHRRFELRPIACKTTVLPLDERGLEPKEGIEPTLPQYHRGSLPLTYFDSVQFFAAVCAIFIASSSDLPCARPALATRTHTSLHFAE